MWYVGIFRKSGRLNKYHDLDTLRINDVSRNLIFHASEKVRIGTNTGPATQRIRRVSWIAKPPSMSVFSKNTGPYRIISEPRHRSLHAVLILFGLSVQNDSCGRVLFCEFQKKSNSWSLLRAYYIPSRPFWYVWISRMFGWAMILILARRSQAKLPMTGSDEPDMPPTPTKKVRLGIYRTPIQQISIVA